MSHRRDSLVRLERGLFGLAVAAVVFLPCAGSRAEVCEGTLKYALERIWDLSGTLDAYFPDFLGDDAGSGRVSLEVTQDPKGKITGFGEFEAVGTEIECEGLFTIKGTLKEVGSVVRVSLVIKLRVLCMVGEDLATLNLTEKVQCELNEAERTLVGTVSLRGTVCVAGEGCMSLVKLAKFFKEEEGRDLPLDQYFEAELEDDMDGSAELTVEMHAVDGKRLIGEAQLALSNGRAYDMAVLGKHDPKKAQNMLKLKGDPLTAKWLALTMIVNCGDGAALLKGQLAGRKILDALFPIGP